MPVPVNINCGTEQSLRDYVCFTSELTLAPDNTITLCFVQQLTTYTRSASNSSGCHLVLQLGVELRITPSYSPCFRYTIPHEIRARSKQSVISSPDCIQSLTILSPAIHESIDIHCTPGRVALGSENSWLRRNDGEWDNLHSDHQPGLMGEEFIAIGRLNIGCLDLISRTPLLTIPSVLRVDLLG